jgi:hypothetical protein
MKSTVLLVFAAVACGGTPPTALKSPEPSGEGGDRLEAEFGGPSGLMEFFVYARASIVAIKIELDVRCSSTGLK